ncbi:hypothetical protein [Haloactinomyces albus]|uniref:Secreted protein n=1 Tax=Haloactinomyces albus TaxID=1352928 RepID=A0AAE3ZDR8_9ACTN|nr:hypothetical protein [Haloactinomyces albus]MDR7301184.1 hypothetical protein [Haloactinomyces albus]
MRPWTTRTLNAAVVAAGFAAVGTGSASAADTATPGLPDLTQAPDDIGITAPLHTCQAAADLPMGPCPNVTVKASIPNVFKQVGADITTMAHGVAGELRDSRQPLSAGNATRVLGHVTAETTRLQRMTDTRPTVSAEVETGNTARTESGGKHAKLLDAEVGPRHSGHEGVSAADTAVDLTAAQGQSIAPLTNSVGTVVPRSVQDAPPQVSDGRVNLPRAGEALPAHRNTPAMAALDDGLTGVAGKTGTTGQTGVARSSGMAERASDTLAGIGTPVGTPSDSLPVVGSVPNPLSNPHSLGL